MLHAQSGVLRGKSLKLNSAIIASLLALIVLTVSVAPQSVNAQTAEFQLTVRNLTEKQPIATAVVIVHTRNAVLLPSSAGRLDGLEEFAESGSNTELINTLQNRTGVKGVFRFVGIAPQAQRTLISLNAEAGDRVSILGSLACTNDAIVLGTVVVTDESGPAFGSGVVWDAGTEDNNESRETVPCLDGQGVSNPDTEDGEGTIQPHRGIEGGADLGPEYSWEGAAIEIVIDQQGVRPRRPFEVGATLENQTSGQPITAPVVVVHDKHVDLLTYTRPAELRGIARLSESGDGEELMTTLASKPGVVSVTQWETGGDIAPGTSFTGSVSAFESNVVTLIGKFACTNDGYVVASAEVPDQSTGTSSGHTVSVFDSGSEDNDETTATVPCLGREAAALSDGVGENASREHPGIEGVGDLNVSRHGWTSGQIATLTLHTGEYTATPVTPVPTPKLGPEPTATPESSGEEELPETGGTTLPAEWAYVIGLLGVIALAASGMLLIAVARRGRIG